MVFSLTLTKGVTSLNLRRASGECSTFGNAASTCTEGRAFPTFRVQHGAWRRRFSDKQRDLEAFAHFAIPVPHLIGAAPSPTLPDAPPKLSPV